MPLRSANHMLGKTAQFLLDSLISGDFLSRIDSMTVIEVRPHRLGWKAFESPGVEPVFPEKDQAIDYAQNPPCFRSGEVRIVDSTGNIERVIPVRRRESL
jgi:hypothetical protein